MRSICKIKGLLYANGDSVAPGTFLNNLSPDLWPAGRSPVASLCDEGERLSVLAGFGVDGLEDDPELSAIAQFAAKLCGAPIALVSIVEDERQRFVAGMGLDAKETPRDQSFCAHAMLGAEVMVVEDATRHRAFRDNPLVTGEPHIRFYAGAPLISSEGAPIGALCIIDRQPRPDGIDDLQREGLQVLAMNVMRRLETQRQDRRSETAISTREDRLHAMIDSVPDIAWSAAPGPVFDTFNARWEAVTGGAHPRTVEEWRAFVHPEDWDASVAKFQASVASAEPFEDQWRMKQADGTWRWVLSRAVPSAPDPARAHWFGTITDIDDSYREAERQDILAKELAHRIKNIFAVIAGLITLRSKAKPEAKAFADELTETVYALGRAQDFVMPLRAEKGDSLRSLLDILTAPYGPGAERQVHVTGDTVKIGFRAATPMALIFHELATNSAKYGALSVSEGRIDVELESDDGTVRIAWKERGGPEVSEPDDSGFGSRLLQMSVQSQLNGAIEHTWERDGLRVVLTLPLASLAD